MKTVVAAILQVVGYLFAVLAVTIAVMGFTKMFVGDWQAGIVATIGTLVLLTILFRRRGARDLPIPLRKSIQTPTVR